MLCEGVGSKTAENVIKDVTAAARAGGGPGEIIAAIEKCEKPGARMLANLMGRIGGRRPDDAYRATLDYYMPILSKVFEDNDQKWRREHLEQTQDLASQYATMEQFLNDVTLDPPSEEEHIVDGGDAGDYLTLSTIHSAKGLEWQYVFIVWVLEGKMPPVHAGIGRDEIEEERRLFYVAATRAKDRLVMSYPAGVMDRFTQAYLYRPSRFVDGLPSGTVHRGEASENTYIRPV